MPFFGTELDAATVEHRDEGARSTTSTGSLEFRLAAVREIAASRGVSMDTVPLVASEGDTRGLADWGAARSAARVLEDGLPMLGRFGVRFVEQVDAYLNVPGVRPRIDAIVSAALTAEPTVVVSHSLGTIVAYSVLSRLSGLDVRLLVTLGSPLGMRTVQERLGRRPLVFPLGVRKWVNVADERDIVALHPRLDGSQFGGEIENLDPVRNRFDDPHNSQDYLGHPRVASVIHAALTEGREVAPFR